MSREPLVTGVVVSVRLRCSASPCGPVLSENPRYFTLSSSAAAASGGVVLAAPPLPQDWSPDAIAGRAGVAAIYWNFVDCVWLVMFPVLYLL